MSNHSKQSHNIEAPMCEAFDGIEPQTEPSESEILHGDLTPKNTLYASDCGTSEFDANGSAATDDGSDSSFRETDQLEYG